jgi:hypothetical protein
LGLLTNLQGVEEDELCSAKLLVTRNGQILTEGCDYTYDKTNVNFLIDILPEDVILLIDPSIGAARRLRGGSYQFWIRNPAEIETEVEAEPPAQPVDTTITTEDTDVTSSDSERDDEESESLEDDDPQS